MALSQLLISASLKAESAAFSALEGFRVAVSWDILIVILVLFNFFLLHLLSAGRLSLPKAAWTEKASNAAPTKAEAAEAGDKVTASGQSMQAPRSQQVEVSGPCYAGPAEEAFCKNVLSMFSSGDLLGAVAAFQQADQQLSKFCQVETLISQLLKASPASTDGASFAWDLYVCTKEHVEYSRSLYNTVAAALVRAGDAEHLDTVLRDMTLENVMPDLITYSAVIRGHVARGDLERSLQVLSLMQRRGVKPDLPAYHAVLEACAQNQMPTLTEQVLNDMLAAGIAPSSATLATLVRLYGRCGDLGAAVRAFEEYPAKYGFKVNAQVYASLIVACTAEGDTMKAFEVYENMVREGHQADAATYKALLSCSLQDGDLDTAAHLLDDAFCKGASRLLARESVELFLMQAVRRGRGRELGEPILQLARQAGMFISERIANNVQRICQ